MRRHNESVFSTLTRQADPKATHSEGGGDTMDTFTVNELAIAGRVSTRAMRKMLNDTGLTPRLDERSTDLTERVSRETVTKLVAMLAGDRVGDRVAKLLRERPPAGAN
jgi:hypothetical protein